MQLKWVKPFATVLLSFLFWLSLMITSLANNLTPLSRSASKIATLFSHVLLWSFGLFVIFVFIVKDTRKDLVKLLKLIIIPGIFSLFLFGLVVYIDQYSLIFSPSTISIQRLEAIE